jgi:hypothetical protein
MTKHYIGTKEVTAWPEARNGQDGFAVKYPDGYTSWSPAPVFTAAYRHTKGEEQRLTFGDAIHFLKAGRRVTRAGWNGKGLWLEMQRPDAHSKMTLPYLYLNYPSDAVNTPGARVPWLASQTDVLAEDWAAMPHPHEAA